MRTEDQKILQAPITVVLGGKEYNIKPLVIRESRLWRAKVVEVLASLPQYFQATSDQPGEFKKALEALLVTNADTVVELFLDYAKDLNREEVEAVATDYEIAQAWNQIIEVAFPLAQSLLGIMRKLSQ